MSSVCVCKWCFTIDDAVLSPNYVSIGLHPLVVWELQVNGKGDFGSSQSWWVIAYVENHSATCKKKEKTNNQTTTRFLRDLWCSHSLCVGCHCLIDILQKEGREYKHLKSYSLNFLNDIRTDLPFQECLYRGSPSFQIGYILVFHAG